ncbi:MAG: IPExxxVDY family protein [Robiginitalea sp.]
MDSLRTVIFTFLVITMGVLEDFWEDLLDETTFSLFAIHSNLEDYALAYALNESCDLRLKRTEKDLELEKLGLFVIFHWKDQENYREWTLFRNPGMEAKTGPSEGLFSHEPAMNRPYLIPERKEVDFFLKLEGEEKGLPILPEILSVPKVITAYRLETAKLKSKYNLIY